MSNVVPFSADSLPAYLQDPKSLRDVNADVVTTAAFPTLSIKGKVFTLVADGERTIVTRPDDPDEAAQSLNLALVRLNMNAKVYYAKKFSNDESDGQRPDCYSSDGVAPSPNSPHPQAKKCALCPHNQFGSRVDDDGNRGKGKACSDHIRAAVANPNKLDRPMLMRVPPASLKAAKDALRVCKSRGIPYNAVVFKVAFVAEAPAPQLSFKPVGLLSDEAYAQADSMYEDETVQAIVGLIDDAPAPAPAEAEDSDTSEFDAAIAAKAHAKAQEKKPAVAEDELAAVLDDEPEAPAPAPAKKAAAKKAPAKAAPAPAPEPELDDDDHEILSGLESLLGATDD